MNMISYFCFCRFFPNFFYVPQRLFVVVDIDTMETLSSGVSTVVSSGTKNFCIVPTTKDPTASVKIRNGKTHWLQGGKRDRGVSLFIKTKRGRIVFFMWKCKKWFGNTFCMPCTWFLIFPKKVVLRWYYLWSPSRIRIGTCYRTYICEHVITCRGRFVLSNKS